MIGQIRGNNLKKRGAGRPAGALLGLLLALALVAVAATPVHASGPPLTPHYFEGTVTQNGVPVAPGTVVEAFVGGDTQARVWTSLFEYEGKSWYTLSVPGTAVDKDRQVRFKVGGVEAPEKGTWKEAGVSFEFNLTIPADTPPPVEYDLTIQSTAGGSVKTPGEGTFSKEAGKVVTLLAEADEGYEFKEWTATEGSFDNPKAANTTFAMPAAAVTITAHFQEEEDDEEPPPVVRYTLTLQASPLVGGTVSPVAGQYQISAGQPVSIVASPNTPDYQFAGWTASPPVSFGNPSAQSTSFNMPANDVIVTAQFTAAPAAPITGCFIATATYGTESAVQIDVLREFRDTVLLPNRLGAGLVSLYYRTSPPLARFISGHDVLREATRVGVVDPIVAVVNWSRGLWGDR